LRGALDFIFFVARSKRLPPLKTKGETHLGVSISEEMVTAKSEHP